MLSSKAIRLSLLELLAADTTTLAPAADNCKVALIMEDFTPNETMDVGDFVLADFTGSTPLNAGLGTQLVGVDPTTGQQILTIKEPAGGWRWECTADPAEDQPIYGYVLLNKDGDDWFGVTKFPTPITITESGQEINLGSVTFTAVLAPLS